VINGVSLAVNAGEVVFLVGPSGAGKSTVLRCMNFLEIPHGGQALFHGQEPQHTDKALNAYRARVGMVFQHFNLFANLTILDNITLAPMKCGLMSRTEAETQALHLLHRIGLRDKARAYPSQLSGGQKQRVAIAGVLAMAPEVLIFDEATSMLDPQGKDEIKKVIRSLHDESGLTILSITHDIDEVAGSDNVLVMDHGKLVLTGTPAEIFSDQDRLNRMRLDIPFSAQLIRSLNKKGVRLRPFMGMEELAEELCRLRSQK
jgi:polar amino acid transport system ATP-binding protein